MLALHPFGARRHLPSRVQRLRELEGLEREVVVAKGEDGPVGIAATSITSLTVDGGLGTDVVTLSGTNVTNRVYTNVP